MCSLRAPAGPRSYTVPNNVSCAWGWCDEFPYVIKALAVEELITYAVLERLKDKALLRRAQAARTKKNHAVSRESVELRNEANDVRSMMERIRGERLQGNWEYPGGEADYNHDWNQLRSQLNELEAKLATVEEPPPSTILAGWETTQNTERTWNNITRARQREIVQAFIERVTINPPALDWRHRHFDTGRVDVEWVGGVKPRRRKPTTKTLTAPRKSSVATSTKRR